MPCVVCSSNREPELGDISGRTSAPCVGLHQSWATSFPSGPRGEALHPSRARELDFDDPTRPCAMC